jgi:hypothetical protein
VAAVSRGADASLDEQAWAARTAAEKKRNGATSRRMITST